MEKKLIRVKVLIYQTQAILEKYQIMALLLHLVLTKIAYTLLSYYTKNLI